MDVLGLAAQHQFQRVPGVFHGLCIAGSLCVLQVGIGVTGELRIDGEPDGAAVHARHLDGVLDPLGAAGDGGHVRFVLLRGEDLFEDGSQLDFTQNAAGLDAGEHLLQPAHIRRKALHLAEALVHLFELGVHGLEALGHPLLQGVLQLLIDGAADFIQLAGVLGLEGRHAVGQRLAQLFELLGVGRFQRLQAPFQNLLLAVLPLGEGGAHVLHGGL